MEQKDQMLRLLKYKRMLLQFKSMGLSKIFSNNLSDAMDVSASLVRRDFAHFDITGNRRGGYTINDVLKRLNGLLGDQRLHEAVLVGCGNLGRALLNHDFIKEGFRLTAAFDINPPEAEINRIPVYPMEVLKNYVMQHHILVGILAVPFAAAAHTRDMMEQAGLRGILNFAPMDLRSNSPCRVHNVNIGLEIENLFFLIQQDEQKKIE
ncbi:MAG: redox-sensing transcriptional repressor Rex [Spirochaetaceae bacterium]|jgi:redox-sensing transcriptional repressor|nr:redox-sensing transcriptional repressor Rex [Spirochaetaceae bacterium]